MSARPRRSYRQALPSLGGITVLLVALAAVIYLNREGVFSFGWRTAALADLQQESGFAYTAPTFRPELSAHEHPSLGEVWEDGHPLAGPGNGSHAEIRAIGHGRFSFWHELVYFSASDNSSPQANGRHYDIHYPLIVGRRIANIAYVAALLGCAATFWVARRAEVTFIGNVPGPLPFYVPAGLLSAVFLVTRLPFFLVYPVVGFAPDTGGYVSVIEMARSGVWPQFALRTPGYPLLIWLGTLFCDRWIAVILLQNLLSFGSILLLTYAVFRLRRSLAVPVALALCGFLGSSQVLLYDTYALSESPYASSVIAFTGLLILALARPQVIYFALASAAMAAAILVRPAGMYLTVIYLGVLAHLLWNRYGASIIGAFLMPFPAILLLFCAYNYATLGSFVISPFGEANFAGATVLYWEPDPRLPPGVNEALKDLPASYERAGISTQDRQTLVSSWNTAWLYPFFARSYNPLVHAEGWGIGRRFGEGDYLQSRSALRDVSLVAIHKHPDLYAKFVYSNLVYYFKGVETKFDYYSFLTSRAEQTYLPGQPGYKLPYAKEYLAAVPPPAITVQAGPPPAVSLAPSFLRRLHECWQRFQWIVFQQIFWSWSYLAILALSLIQLARFRGRHFGAFILAVLTATALGASLVVCLVEISIERYSYPTQFIYYLSVALIPLLWMPNRAEPTQGSSPPQIGRHENNP